MSLSPHEYEARIDKELSSEKTKLYGRKDMDIVRVVDTPIRLGRGDGHLY